MKRVIFTICAKNYMAQAKTLGDSVKKFHPECDFTILLSDELDGYDLNSNYPVVESKTIGIKDFELMAFKYDVIEFSTAIKPYFIQNLFDAGYEKVLYVDPDMVIYSKLDFVFEHLDKYDAVLTPHLLKPYIQYDGATSEEELLFVGIYNLGFFGVKNSSTGQHITKWWMQKLADQCYADKEDALHVDQRWMDFLPSLYTEQTLITRHPGINLAFWNFHERELSKVADEYKVDGQDLAILHYSGLDTNDIFNICRKQTKYSFDNKPEYKELFEDYLARLKQNGLDVLSKLQYKYNHYDNGIYILKYQRRLFRALKDEVNGVYTAINHDHPFSTAKGTFYNLLETNKLVINDKVGEYSTLKKKYTNPSSMINKVYSLMRLFIKVFGIKNYYLLMRFMAIYYRFEKQTFLFKKKAN
jgi:hypothetical protein